MGKRVRWHCEQASDDHQCNVECWFKYGYDDDDDIDGAVARLIQARDDNEARTIEAGLLAETDNDRHPGDPEELVEQ